MCNLCQNGNCTLQQVANDLNLIDLPFKERFEDTPWDKTFPLIRDSRKCIKCMRCIQICDKIQGLNIWDVTSTGSRTTINVNGNKKINEVSCSLCGQCITHCPVGALRERDDTETYGVRLLTRRKLLSHSCSGSPCRVGRGSRSFQRRSNNRKDHGRLEKDRRRLRLRYFFLC